METQFVKNVSEMKKRYTEDGPDVITITHVVDCADKVKTRTITGIAVNSSPNDLATAFLEFVTIDTVPYTEKELDKVAQVIIDIHQRYYKSKIEKD